MSRRLTIDEFIEKAINRHGNKYDYSKVIYFNNDINIIIICPIHGGFLQRPGNHLNGKYGCTNCGINREKYNKINKRKNDKENSLINKVDNFFTKCLEIHNNRYDYSLAKYTNTSAKIIIICREHGEFLQRASAHLDGQGCMSCRLDKRRTGLDSFIERCIEIHGDKYDYSLINEYTNSRDKVKVICKKHDIFEITPYHHTNRKQGCSICNESFGEITISKYLNNRNIVFVREHTFTDCRNIKELRYDFYIENIRTCIEYNGIQHYEAIEYFGGIDTLDKQILNDKIKSEYCFLNNIHLITIKYDEDINEKLTTLLDTHHCLKP